MGRAVAGFGPPDAQDIAPAARPASRVRQLVPRLGFQLEVPYISGMLRMRPKPPAGLPTVNSRTPWSEMDLADLQELLRDRRSVAEIADFLCREVDEVEDKIARPRS
jgi:hypothetical protein